MSAPSTARGRTVVVVLTYNNVDDTLECLRAARGMSPACDELLVVDNGSTDGSATRIAEACGSSVRVVRLERNGGFTAGANRALAEALARGAEYVLFLANDTVPAPGLLGRLRATADRDTRVGLVGPRVMEYDAPERLQHGAGFLGGPVGRTRVADASRTVECDWVTGCGFLVRADALRAMPGAPGFDERFFLYWEDIDFSRRIAAGGYRVMYEPGAELLHKESELRHARASATKRDSRLFYMIRNDYLFARRHLHGHRRRLALAHRLLIGLPRRLAASVVRKRRVDARELALVARAHLDGMRGREGRADVAGLY